MRVAFDTTPIVRATYPAGVRRACRGLVEALERRGVLEVVRLSPPDDASERRWRHLDLPDLLSRKRCFGLHSSISAFPWRGPGRRVHTVHELPWRHGVRENAGLAHRFWASFGARRADAVLCATELVARDLRGSVLVDPGKVHVCPWGITPRTDTTPPPHPADSPPFALCLGAVRPKKNLRAAVHGLAHLHGDGARDWRLIVTGGPTPTLLEDLALAAELSIGDAVVTPGTLTDPELAALLRGAAAVLVLSTSEGFGFPVLEAMAHGTPVVVPAGTSQAEVAGAAAIVVEPRDPASVARGLQRAVAEREALRPALLERAGELSWERCASRVESLWLGWDR